MNLPSNAVPTGARHAGPNLGIVAIVFTILFNLGLYFVISFSAAKPHFPGPRDSADTIITYFQAHSSAVMMCAFFQFGSAIVVGIFTAAAVSRLRFLGVRAAGPSIALFGGFATAINIAVSALILWVMAYPGIAENGAVLRALYYLSFAVGGVGFSAPLGLLMAGISVSAGFMKLLPKWIVVLGVVLAAIGELSSLNLIFPAALFLIPLTRFPGFVWLIAAGFKLPKVAARASSPTSA